MKSSPPSTPRIFMPGSSFGTTALRVTLPTDFLPQHVQDVRCVARGLPRPVPAPSPFAKGEIFTMNNLMMVTSAALLMASQAQAEFLSCAYFEAASILRNSTRNGLPSDVNDPRVLQGFLNGSRVRCAMDRDEWVDSCVRTALRTSVMLLRPPQTEKDTKPLIDRCERNAAEAAKAVFEKLKANVRNGTVEPPPVEHPR